MALASAGFINSSLAPGGDFRSWHKANIATTKT
jgi:hypothetical protein